jgi:signal transduction histidine kinase
LEGSSNIMAKYEPQLPKEIDYQAIAEAIVRMAPTYRAPYVSIIGFSEALLEGLSGELSDLQKTDVDSIRVSGWQALGHLNDILDVMLLISGEIEYERHILDVNQLLKDVVRGVERTHLEPGQSLNLTPASEAVYIQGDELRLRQAMLGLIGNAMVTAPAMPIYIIAAVKDKMVEITVRDGCQVANIDDLTYFFEPGWMSKLDSGRWRQMQWQSYLAHHFVSAHGGTIWVDTVKGEDGKVAGTAVTLALPLAEKS